MVVSATVKNAAGNLHKPNKWRSLRRNTKMNWELYVIIALPVIWLLIFSYYPMYGVQIAFRKFIASKGIMGSPWVGLAYFEKFIKSYNFSRVIRNTLSISLYDLVLGFPFPIILALLLNSFTHLKYRKAIQAITYAQHFISTVVMSGIIILFLSPRLGVVNTLLKAMGGQAINFMGKSDYWRHIYVWTGVWQSMGWNSIIYFAALSGVSPEFHEAAIVDGATKLQRIRHIDIPFLAPVISMLLILNFGSVLSIGFEKAYALQNDLNLSVSEIISTYVYKLGILQRDQSFSTAIGLFNSVVNMVLLVMVNAASRRLGDTSLW